MTYDMSFLPGKVAGVAGTVVAGIGAVDGDKLATWGGFALAAISTIATFAWSQYHKFRESKRREDAADKLTEVRVIREQIKAQLELEQRLQSSVISIANLEKRISELTLAVVQRTPTQEAPPKCSQN